MKLTTQKKMLAICSQAELGRRLNRRAQTVNGWFKKKVPGELVVRVLAYALWRPMLSVATQRLPLSRVNHPAP